MKQGATIKIRHSFATVLSVSPDAVVIQMRSGDFTVPAGGYFTTRVDGRFFGFQVVSIGDEITLERTTDGVLPRSPMRAGQYLRRLIHATLDGIERAVRLFSRDRRHLGWIVKVKSCGGCNGRAEWIDKHVRPDRWAARIVRGLGPRHGSRA